MPVLVRLPLAFASLLTILAYSGLNLDSRGGNNHAFAFVNSCPCCTDWNLLRTAVSVLWPVTELLESGVSCGSLASCGSLKPALH